MATKKADGDALTATESLQQTARDDVCRLISHACTMCINGQTRESMETMFQGIAAMYQAVK